jgi:hypothetical protein
MTMTRRCPDEEVQLTSRNPRVKTNKEKFVYVQPNFASKAALKRALASGDTVTVFAPGLGQPVQNGIETIEGPHYPAPHTWYARVNVVDGRVTKLIK